MPKRLNFPSLEGSEIEMKDEVLVFGHSLGADIETE